jgi:hypothetical protein
MHRCACSRRSFRRWKSLSFTGADRVNRFGARGSSGGPLIDQGEFISDESYHREPKGNAKLAGMIIEYYEEHSAPVSVRIGLIVEAIRRVGRHIS